MLESILDQEQHECLKEERRLLAEIESALSRRQATGHDLETLVASIVQLDELFLVVVVGEFNAGKSALINAFLAQQVLAEGVTPTTCEIHRIGYGDQLRSETTAAGHRLVTAPVPLLRQVCIVDTPGTNALDRRHEAITTDFIPRSDLVVFVTSADRPLSESERAFLERTRSWGKKVVLVLNKVDLLRRPQEVDEIIAYITEHSRQLLGMTPEIFPISARGAQEARTGGDDGALTDSGLPIFEAHLLRTLEQAERVRLKLLNPIGVARTLLAQHLREVESRLEALREDIVTLEDIDRQLTTFAEDIDREFRLRLSDIDNSLNAMEKRGLAFYDDALRLARIPLLFNRDELQRSFELKVVAGTPGEIESKVASLIDWLVDSVLNQWQAVVRHVGKRQTSHTERIVGEVGGRFEYDRTGLLETVGRSARKELEAYDRAAEARRMAEEAQRAVAGAALMEAGAVGLGATITLLASGSAADATGLVAAGVVAILGLFILPNRRRRAKRELEEKIQSLRSSLRQTLSDHFRNEADRSLGSIRETIAPYTRFVRSEREHLGSSREELTAFLQRVEQLQGRIEAATTQRSE